MIDYTKDEYPKNGERYDFIFDATPFQKGNRKRLAERCKQALTPNGKYLSVDNGTPKSRAVELSLLKGLIEEGNLKSVIGSVFSLEQLPEAHRYIEQGHKVGSVVVKIS